MKFESIRNLIKLKTRNVRKVIANWIYSGPTTNDILDAQAQHIQMLQDNATKLYAMMTRMVQPIIESNKLMQLELKAQREYNIQLKNIDYDMTIKKFND